MSKTDNIRNVLGRDLDIDRFESVWTPQKLKEELPNGATPVGWEWRSLNKEADDNLAVRAGGTPNADDTLGNDLLRDGWDCTKKPVLVDVEVGDIIDGRTRESTMKNLDTNEEWIPVLKVIVSPSLRRCVAQKSNYHSYSTRSVSADLIVSLIADIDEGIIDATEDAVRTRLYKDYEVEKLLSNGNGAITKIITQTLERALNADKVLRIKGDREWAQWVYDNDQKYQGHVLQAGGKAPDRFFVNYILPARGKEKVQVVLFVREYTLQRAQNAVKEFKQKVDRLYRDAFYMTSAKVFSQKIGLDGIINPSDVYEIVGVCPQVQNDVQKDLYENGELVSYEEFITSKEPTVIKFAA